MLDALERTHERLRGIAVADRTQATRACLDRWHASSVPGLRFNHFFRHGQPYYSGGIGIDEAEALAPALAARG